MFRRNRSRITQRLSGSAYKLTIPRKTRVLPWILGSLLIVLCATAYALLQTPPATLQTQAELSRLQQEVERLQHDLKVGEMRLQQEVVTREELAHQMDVQSQKLRQAEQEVQFFRGQQKDKIGRNGGGPN